MVRNLSILFFAQFAAATGSITLVTLGGIIGTELSAKPALATLPLSLMVVGTAASTIPAALLMRAIGRPLGSAAAAGTAVLAFLIGALSLKTGSFALLCLALTLNGVNLAFVQQYRFAAAESVSPDRVGRAVSIVLLASIGGAIAGPLLARTTRHLVAGTEYAGTMLSLAALMAVSAALLLFLNRDGHAAHQDTQAPTRPLREIVLQPLYVVAVMGGVAAYGIMSFIMTATPISMHVVDGFSIEETSGVIRSHVIAMYAPSLVSGFLIERFGVLRLMGVGAIAMLLTSVIGLAGHAMMHYWFALVLLGIGWNFLYVGGTTLLTRTYRSQ
ncbi:MAG: MFS transporter, partial [Pseudomonadota bacterium]